MARFLVFSWILVMNAHLISVIAADSEEKQAIGAALTPRKLGMHDLHSKIAPPSPSPSPSQALRAEESGSGAAQEQVMRSHHRHSFDRSVAGGGAVIGVLAIGFLVAVFCYIRATARKHVQPGSPTDTSSSIGRKNVESNSLTHP